MRGSPELTVVEQPLLDQLASMRWKVIVGSVDFPSVTGREAFREVFMNEGSRREEVERSKLRLLKQGLMEDLLTGRVRVTALLDEAAK